MTMDVDPDITSSTGDAELAAPIHSISALQALTLDVGDPPHQSPTKLNSAPPASPTRPTHSSLTPFATSFLALPPELLTHILLYLAPDDLGVLSRVVGPLEGIERDRYLWAVWVHSVSLTLLQLLRAVVSQPYTWARLIHCLSLGSRPAH